MAIDVSTLRPGDRVQIVVEVAEEGPSQNGEYVACLFGPGRVIWINKDALVSGTLLPRPIKVGDRIRDDVGDVIEVRAVDDEAVWVRIIRPSGQMERGVLNEADLHRYLREVPQS